MKFKSALVTQVSGSVGGMTGSHNKGGMYFRARSIPTNPNTPAQQAARAVFTQMTQLWATLTQSQRDAWETYAANVPVTNALGDTINLSGQQMFVRNNSARVAVPASLSPVLDGPTTFNLGDAGEIEITSVSSGTNAIVSFNINGSPEWASTDNAYLSDAISREQAPSINFFKGPYRQQIGTPTIGSSTTPPSSGSGTSAFAGTTGNKVFAAYRGIYPDGRVSAIVRATGTIV